MTKLSKARQRGLWPEHGPIIYGDRPRVEVAISMEKEDYDWLADFVQATGHVWCVEDALNKAVAAMRGDEPMAYFAEGIASQHGMSASDLLFKPRGAAAAPPAHRLFMAAWFIGELSRSDMFEFVRDDNLPPPEVLALAQAALGEGRNLDAEIETARKEVAEFEAKELADLDGEEPTYNPKLDDDLPF